MDVTRPARRGGDRGTGTAQHAARVLTGTAGRPKESSSRLWRAAAGTGARPLQQQVWHGVVKARNYFDSRNGAELPPWNMRDPYERTERAGGWLVPLRRCKTTVGKGPPQSKRKPERGASAHALALRQTATPLTWHGLRCVYARVCGAPRDATDVVNSFNNSY